MFRANWDYFEDRPRDIVAEHNRRVNYHVNIMFQIRTLNDPFAVSLDDFKGSYRLPQHLFFELCEKIAPFMRERRDNVHFIPLEIKVLCAIAVYSSGSYQKVMGKMADLSICQATVCNALEEVTEALNHPDILTEYIRFPRTRQEIEFSIARNERLGMPFVLGFIDGTLVKIVPPPRHMDMEAYWCRKGYCALNVQIVCDADLYIMDVNARFPGSANDPYVYDQSGMREVMRRVYRQTRCWLLGDSIYPHEPWLQTPINHAEPGTPEYEYTQLHCHCRNAGERCNGVLKARWRCLLHDRTLHYRPVKAGRIVNACVVLHNFCVLNRLADPDPEIEPNEPDVFDDVHGGPFDDDDDDDEYDNIQERQRRLLLRQQALENRQLLIDHALVHAPDP